MIIIDILSVRMVSISVFVNVCMVSRVVENSIVVSWLVCLMLLLRFLFWVCRKVCVIVFIFGRCF